MKLMIKPLSPDLSGDYLNFFDNDAFADHQDWSWCYCLECYMSKADEEALGKTKESRRAKAEELIANGVLNGYLAYEDGKVIGWCNASDKSQYARLRELGELWGEGDTETNVVSVVCFVIASNRRSKGVATALLERVLSDAAAKGLAYVEAYPTKVGGNCFEEYHGPAGLYDKFGFVLHKDLERRQIVRKYL